MSKRTALKTVLWVFVLASAVMIFMFSAQDATASNDTSGSFIRFVFGLFPGFRRMSLAAQDGLVESVMFIVRKCAHFCIYAFLGFWLMHLVRQYRKERALLMTVVFSMAYAVTDEIHQYFVPGRTCQLRDVCIDTLGALTGALVALLFAVIWQKLRKLHGGVV